MPRNQTTSPTTKKAETKKETAKVETKKTVDYKISKNVDILLTNASKALPSGEQRLPDWLEVIWKKYIDEDQFWGDWKVVACDHLPLFHPRIIL